MKFTRAIKLALVAASVSFNVNAGPISGNVAQVLVKESGLLRLLGKMGVKGQNSTTVKTYVKNSLSAVMVSGQNVTAKRLKKAVEAFQTKRPAELRMKRRLLHVLDRPAGQVSKQELVDSLNDFVYLTSRYGINQSAVLTCRLCVSDSLSLHGFKFSIEAINDASLKLAIDTIPTKPEYLTKHIKNKMHQYRLGELDSSLVSSADEKNLALFLALRDFGSKAQREYYKAVLKYSTRPDGSIKLIDPENSHRFWSVFNLNGEVDYKKMAKLLKDVSKKGKESVNKKEVFYAHLRSITDDTEVVAKMEKKDCFF